MYSVYEHEHDDLITVSAYDVDVLCRCTKVTKQQNPDTVISLVSVHVYVQMGYNNGCMQSN